MTSFSIVAPLLLELCKEQTNKQTDTSDYNNPPSMWREFRATAKGTNGEYTNKMVETYVWVNDVEVPVHVVSRVPLYGHLH